MATIFDKWNNNANLANLQKDIADAEANSGSSNNYREVPVGTYECKIEKLELVENSKGNPMVTVWFRILEGDFKNAMMFMNQVINQGWQIAICNDFLKSLESGVSPIEFKDYAQYHNMLMDIAEAIDKKLEFLVEYKKSKKDFSVYTIKDVYEV